MNNKKSMAERLGIKKTEVPAVKQAKKVVAETKPLVRRSEGDDQRAPLNHATEDANTTEIGGMNFRRQRAGFDDSSNKTLDIPKRVLNNELEYRWVNDDKGRVERLRELGYETVDDSTIKGEGISTQRRVGSKKDGSDLNAVLMATPKKWHKERQNNKERERQEHERGVFSGETDADGKALGKGYYNKNSNIDTNK